LEDILMVQQNSHEKKALVACKELCHTIFDITLKKTHNPSCT
jgi:hypothetical protein